MSGMAQSGLQATEAGFLPEQMTVTALLSSDAGRNAAGRASVHYNRGKEVTTVIQEAKAWKSCTL